MKTPITVCDDSMLSRKNVIKALPESWDVEVTECKHGLEALEACRAGKAEVLFLDLTMPIMDGLEVLERLKGEDLKTVVIVISADFQPEVQEKVTALGALTFIRKPVTPEQLEGVLKGSGLI
ncbi:response regulator [Marinobacterium sp. AK62]|uniref:Response regulator n=1 Tax=Marinobacterium alkalitolerans TaxID=1542925 RepID=A0ABS3Z6S2_9GAMM|nr:response regulator [Marinobacterium alkalitolerans]MBP0047412.1 response regulator [Marinobacterium alkalitolerans]